MMDSYLAQAIGWIVVLVMLAGVWGFAMLCGWLAGVISGTAFEFVWPANPTATTKHR